MAFWENQMPAGMCLRSNWGASHIADPKRAADSRRILSAKRAITYRSLSRSIASLITVAGIQSQAVPDLDKRQVRSIETDARGFKVTMADGEEFTSRRVVVAGGISPFASKPAEFAGIPSALASHTSEHKDLGKFKGQRVVVIGAGQSALESAALFKELGIPVEVIARTNHLNWVGLACEIAPSGSDFQNDVFESRRWPGRDQPSRCRAASVPSFPPSFPGSHCLPRDPARWRRLAATTNRGNTHHSGAQGGLRDCRGQPTSPATGRRIGAARRSCAARNGIPSRCLAISFPVSVIVETSENGERLPCSSSAGWSRLIPGLHFVGKPAAWSFGPLLGFVSGAEFASNELVRSITRRNGSN